MQNQIKRIRHNIQNDHGQLVYRIKEIHELFNDKIRVLSRSANISWHLNIAYLYLKKEIKPEGTDYLETNKNLTFSRFIIRNNVR